VATPLLGGRIHVPTVPKAFVRLFLLLLFLQLLDMAVFQHAAENLLENGPSVNILFKFETVILLVAAWRHALLLHLHYVDGLLQHAHDRSWVLARSLLHPWKEYRATLVFAVELQAQAFQFLFYVAFFGTVLTYYGMPINLFREVYLSFAALRERVLAFMKYRKLMGRMNRFDSASAEQLDESGRTCIICRDDMTPRDGKVLPGCNHVFHKSCLREWLVQQQTCPTCRSDIDAMATRQHQQRQAAAQAEDRQRGGPGEEDGANNNNHAAEPMMPPPGPHRAGAPDGAPAAAPQERGAGPPPPAAPTSQHSQDPLQQASSSSSSDAASPAAAATSAVPSPGIQHAAPPMPAVPAPVRAVVPWHPAQLLEQQQQRDLPPPKRVRLEEGAEAEPPVVRLPAPTFPSLYRVTSPDGTAVWTGSDDDDEDDDRTDHPKQGGSTGGIFGDSTRVVVHDDNRIGSSSSAAGPLLLRARRLVPAGTVVLCTSAALDSTGSLFLRVPGGWVGEGDVVRVSAVPPSTSSPLPFT
jgi:Ring finger domain